MKNKIIIPNLKMNNNRLIPVLGLGTWELKGELCESSVKEAFNIGYRHIDTAEIYRNEEYIGKAIKNIPREKLFIVSKVWPLHLSYKGVLKACKDSLSRLGTDHIDLYLIHWPSIFGSMEEPLKAFKKLYNEGKIKSFGVSNFSINNLIKILPMADKLGLKISINQIKYNPLNHNDVLVDFCRKNNIIVTAYSPLDRGKAVHNEEIIKMAKKYGKTPTQIILRWINQKNIVVIPKASSKYHLEENTDIFDFTITNEDMSKIDNIQK